MSSNDACARRDDASISQRVKNSLYKAHPKASARGHPKIGWSVQRCGRTHCTGVFRFSAKDLDPIPAELQPKFWDNQNTRDHVPRCAPAPETRNSKPYSAGTRKDGGLCELVRMASIKLSLRPRLSTHPVNEKLYTKPTRALG